MLLQLQPKTIFTDSKLIEQKSSDSKNCGLNPQTHSASIVIYKKRGRKSWQLSSAEHLGAKTEGQCPQVQNFGHWSIYQNKRYHWFLQIHNSHFLNKHMRRMDKIFKTMAMFIGTRQAEQCRSHHQKMEKKYNRSICLILLNLRRQNYNSEEETQLEYEITLNQVELYNGLLTAKFLIEQAERLQKQNQGGIRQTQVELQPCEEQRKEEKFQQRKLLEEGTIKMEGLDVDLLLQDYDYAPHILFEMI